jgi:hypothetical protein
MNTYRGGLARLPQAEESAQAENENQAKLGSDLARSNALRNNKMKRAHRKTRPWRDSRSGNLLLRADARRRKLVGEADPLLESAGGGDPGASWWRCTTDQQGRDSTGYQDGSTAEVSTWHYRIVWWTPAVVPSMATQKFSWNRIGIRRLCGGWAMGVQLGFVLGKVNPPDHSIMELPW